MSTPIDCARFRYTQHIPLSSTLEALDKKELLLRPANPQFTPKRVDDLKKAITFTDALSDHITTKYYQRYFFIALIVIWIAKKLQLGGFGHLEAIRNSFSLRLNQETALLETQDIADEAMEFVKKLKRGSAGDHYISLQKRHIIETTKVKVVEKAVLYSVREKTCRLVAKISPNEGATSGAKKSINREFTFVNRLKNAPGIWPILHAEENCYYSELAEGTFSKLAKTFTREELLSAIKTVLEGLVALEHAAILHMDIKGSNILVSRTQNKVGINDFGLADDMNSDALARRFKQYETYGKYGTAQYTPPELLGVQGLAPSYKLDIWPFAVSIYRVVIEENPYWMKKIPKKIEGLTREEQDGYKRAIQEAVDRLAIFPQNSLEAFIAKLLEPDPQKRLTAALALEAIAAVTC